jgi:transcription elongation factor Elf1
MTLHIDNKYVRLISHRVRNFKQKSDNLYNFSCPLCGDSKTNLSKARGYTFAKGNSLFYKCHNCGAGTNLGNLLKNVDSELHKEYVLERYKSGESGFSNFKDPKFDIPSPKFDKVSKQTVFEHAQPIGELPSGHYCLSYVQGRKLPQDKYNLLYFTPNYKEFILSLVPDYEKELLPDARLVIPFYNEYNELIAVTGRALETSDKTLRYVTVRTIESNNKLVYGMDRVDLNKPVRIVEGPVDSLFIDNCIASGDASLALTAKNIDCKEKLLIFDNQPRNKEVCKLMLDAIKLELNVVIWPDYIESKDINDMIVTGISKDEIETIISSNSFSGLEAQTRFTFWKKV